MHPTSDMTCTSADSQVSNYLDISSRRLINETTSLSAAAQFICACTDGSPAVRL